MTPDGKSEVKERMNNNNNNRKGKYGQTFIKQNTQKD